jgi:hypothetical protein
MMLNANKNITLPDCHDMDSGRILQRAQRVLTYRYFQAKIAQKCREREGV